MRASAPIGKRVLAALAAFVPIGTLAAACCSDGTHIYSGRLYRDDRTCLATTSSIDVISGDDPGTCAPVCLVQKSGDGGTAVYVSTMCAPYPPGHETNGQDPRCAGAFAALSRDDTCLLDGSTHPTPKDASAPDASSSD